MFWVMVSFLFPIISTCLHKIRPVLWKSAKLARYNKDIAWRTIVKLFSLKKLLLHKKSHPSSTKSHRTNCGILPCKVYEKCGMISEKTRFSRITSQNVRCFRKSIYNIHCRLSHTLHIKCNLMIFKKVDNSLGKTIGQCGFKDPVN